MATMNDSTTLLPDILSKVSVMGPHALEAVHRFVQQIELATLMEELQDDAEQLRTAGGLDESALKAAIEDHRQRHPYR